MARVAALLAGALALLAFPEPSLWWLAWVVLVPLVAVVAAAPSGREAAVRTWLGGLGFGVGVAYWSVTEMGPALFVLAAALGAVWIPWGLAARHLLRGRPDRRKVVTACSVLAAGWVVIEFARSWEHFGGPGALLGSTQWNSPPTLAPAAVGGVWLVSFLVVAVNVAVVFALRRDAAPGVRLLAVAVALALVSAGPAWHALRPSPPARTVRTALVQPGQPSAAGQRVAAHIAATRRLAGTGVELVVWGESSVKYDLVARSDTTRAIERLAAEVGAPILLNVDARQRGKISKTAVLVTADGIAGRYDKMRLVLFGEYVPLRPVLGWISRISGAADENRRRGDRLLVMDAGQVRVGPLVSFELLFPDMARNLTRRGAGLVAVQSMTSSFQDSWAPEQAVSVAAVRAVENDRPVVYSTMTGVSAAFDGHGQQQGWLSTARRGNLVVDVPVSTTRTPYTRFGPWVPAVSLLILVLAATSLVRTRTRQ